MSKYVDEDRLNADVVQGVYKDGLYLFSLEHLSLKKPTEPMEHVGKKNTNNKYG